MRRHGRRRARPMRVSVVQMSPTHRQGGQHCASAPPDGASDRRRPARHCEPARGLDAASAAIAGHKFAAGGTAAAAAAPTQRAGLPTSSFERSRAPAASTCMAARSSSGVSDKLFNTTVVFDPDGTEIARYRKIHLFDIVTPDGRDYRESATYGGGRRGRHLRGRRRHASAAPSATTFAFPSCSWPCAAPGPS